MSSNHNHIIPVLTRDNYEEAFLLYVDDELTPDQKKAVDDFVLLHPDLKEELELLCSAKLPAAEITFQNKEELFADSMKVNAVDESLLLYIDNELPAWEREIVEAQLKKNEAFAQQHQLLLKTRLHPEPVPYPYKKELYRHTERRIVPYWLRIAAAAVLITGTGTAVWLNSDNTKHTDSTVAATIPNTTPQPSAPVVKPIEAPAGKKESNNLVATTKNTISKKEHTTALQVAVTAKRVNKKESKSTISKPQIADEHPVASNHLPMAKKVDSGTIQTDMAIKTSEPVLNNSIVTSETGSAYVKTDAADRTTDPVHAVVTTNEQKGGVKMLLRKATRFIERRTGIKAVNDDDELLVGAVALKL